MLSDELDSIDDIAAGDRCLRLHPNGIVNANKAAILLKQHNFINLLKVVDFLDLAVVGSVVTDLLRLCVHHINLSCILCVVLDLVLD